MRSDDLVTDWKPGMLAACVDAAGTDVLTLHRRYTARTVDAVPFGQGEHRVGLRLEGITRPDYVNGDGVVFSDYPFGSKRFRPVMEERS